MFDFALFGQSCASKTKLRKSLWIAATFVVVQPFVCAASNSFDLDEISQGVFVHIGKPLRLDSPGHDDIANIGFIIGTRCVAVIDTGGSMRIGRALYAALRRRTSVRICYVINTHVHVDHVLGNAAFREGKPSYVGHAALHDALARSREFFLQTYAADLDTPADPDQIIAPDRSVAVDDDVDLDLGGRHLTLHAWPKAHTDCDLTVYDHQTRTLWAGDLLFVGRLPAIDGSVIGWLSAINTLASMSIKHVVPGHGGVRSELAEPINAERRYLQSLVTEVRSEISLGKPMQAAIKEVGGTEKTRWLLWESTHPHNVARVYEELEWEDAPPRVH